MSSSSQSIAERLIRLVGRPDLVDQPWFRTGQGRAEHADELDTAVAGWIGERSADEVVKLVGEVQAAVAPVYDIRGVMSDPQYAALETVVRVPDDDLGPLAMQNVFPRLSRTPGEIRWTGRAHGADTDEVLGELGYDADQVARLRAAGVV